MRRLLSLAALFLFCELTLVAVPVSRADDDCKSGTPEKFDEATFAVSGKHPASVSDSVTKLGPPHFSNRAQTDYCLSSDGKVTAAIVTLEGTINTPSWKDEAATPDKYKPFIRTYLAFIKAHEDRHAAITRRVFKDAHKKLIGKKEADANALIKKLECDEAKEHYALDKKEGKAVVHWNAATDVCTQVVSGRERPEYLDACK